MLNLPGMAELLYEISLEDLVVAAVGIFYQWETGISFEINQHRHYYSTCLVVDIFFLRVQESFKQ